MDILVENGTHRLENLGDLAMLKVTCQRLRMHWPHATLHAVTLDQEELNHHLKGVQAAEPLLSQWRKQISPMAFQQNSKLWEKITNLFVPLLFHSPIPTLFNNSEIAFNDFDLVVMSGSGILADPFTKPAMLRLHTLMMAQKHGIPTALFGQGLGPMQRLQLRRMAAPILKRANLISLREGLKSPALLQELGVLDSRYLICGDDSLAAANKFANTSETRTKLGLNLRFAPYSNITAKNGQLLTSIESALEEFLVAQRATVAPLAVHRADHIQLQDNLQRLQPYLPPVLHDHTLPAIFSTTIHCRLVVAGSYHAAVFALALGIPVICLAGSQYYRWKFEGLANQFPEGCTVLDLQSGFRQPQLQHLLHTYWSTSDSMKSNILRRTREQIGLSESAYQKLAELQIMHPNDSQD